MAHSSIAFTGGLSKMPLINSALVPDLSALLRLQSLIMNTYSTLQKSVRELLIADWAQLFPLLAYYLHPPTLHPRPFMGRSQFLA